MSSRSRLRRRLQRRLARPAGWLTALVVLGLVVGIGFAWRSFNGRVDEDVSGGSHLRPVTVETPPEPKVILVVGDSWTEGSDMNEGPEWMNLWDLDPAEYVVIQEGQGGTGYLADDPAQALEPDRLKYLTDLYDPDIVLMALGRNDVEVEPKSALERAAVSGLEKAQAGWPDARIVVFSPFSPTEPNPFTVETTAALKRAAEEVDLPFLDVSHLMAAHPELIGADTSHPTDDGEAYLAQRIRAGLTRLGVEF